MERLAMTELKDTRVKAAIIRRRVKNNSELEPDTASPKKLDQAPSPISPIKELKDTRVKSIVIGRRKPKQKSTSETASPVKLDHAPSAIIPAKDRTRISVKPSVKPKRKKINPEFELDRALSINSETAITSSAIEEPKSKRNEVDTPQKQLFDFKNTKEFIVDALNVCFDYPRSEGDFSFEALLTLLVELKKRGGSFKCIFDANGYHQIKDICPNNLKWYKKLKRNIPNNFLEVPSRIRADDFILNQADKHGNLIISNDTFMEYSKKYPWTCDREDMRIIKGMLVSDEIQIPQLDINLPLRKDVETMVEELISYFRS